MTNKSTFFRYWLIERYSYDMIIAWSVLIMFLVEYGEESLPLLLHVDLFVI